MFPNRKRWFLKQTWKKQLLVHYAIEPQLIWRLVPDNLEIDLFNGMAYVTISARKNDNVRFRWFPILPKANEYYSIEVRTYVKYQGKQGVYFFSRDASSFLATLGSRFSMFAPYSRANMLVKDHNGGITFHSRRYKEKSDNGEFRCFYKPGPAISGTGRSDLDEWLTQRDYHYTDLTASIITETEINHPKYMLQEGNVEIVQNTMTVSLGLPLPLEPVRVHYCDSTPVNIFPVKLFRHN